MHIFPKTNFDFLGMRWKFFMISGLLLGGSLVSLAVTGLRYGIDFTGGTDVQITFDKPVALADLRKAVTASGMPNAAIQSFTGTNTFSLRIQSENQNSSEQLDKNLAELQKTMGDAHFAIDSKQYVGPAVGKHLFQQAMWAIVLSLLGIIIYLAFRFANPVWGVAGIIALFHDVLATLGLFSILHIEVDLLIVSAILTIGGYSIHDTIVIFDRIREKLHIVRGQPLKQVMDESMNETLSRTIITSSTVLVVVTILYFLGGPVIHHFALAMVFGTIVGTYSSIAVAAALVYEWTLRNTKGRVDEPATVSVKGGQNKITKPKPISKK